MTGINLFGRIVAVITMIIGMIYDALYLLSGRITDGASVYFGAGIFLVGLLFLLHFISAAHLQVKLDAILDDLNARHRE